MFASCSDAQHDSKDWQVLLPEAKLEMDKQHYFER